ncbi:MAG: hypothetical protein M3N95_07050 [Actinomycetota bacterium]|nr:hypothetical protein [Actinomycetota bacterium]
MSTAKSTRDKLAAAAASGVTRQPTETPAASQAANRPGRQTKYTLLLDQGDEDTIQDFVYNTRRELGVPIDKSDAYRAFLALLRDDPQLAGRVRDYIAAAK